VTPQEIADKYPEFAPWLQIPEIADLLTKAATENWTSGKLNLALWNTDWWKTTPATARDWTKTVLSDPATAKQKSSTTGADVNAIALGLGYHLTPNEVAYITNEALSQGWDSQAITRSIVDNVSRNRIQAGTIDSTRDSLMSTAAQYGVNMTDKMYTDWATNIATGRQTAEGFQDYAKYHAGIAYPQLKAELDAGLTVRQIADPYLQAAGNLLGVDPNQMKLTDPKWQRALQARDAKGKIAGPMTMADWNKTVMTDASYGYDKSDNGKLAARQMQQSLGQMFGVSS
jgi:hypothetical protein